MKKKILSVVFILCVVWSYGQFPNDHGFSSPLTKEHAKGLLTADSGFQVPNVDTLNNRATLFTGALTLNRPDTGLYMSNGGYWVKIGNNIFYVESPLVVDRISQAGKTILKILHNDGVVSGGIVTWSGTGLVFDVSATVYYINHIQYIAPATQITLSASDITNNRIDLIGVNTSGVAFKRTGTPSGSPAAPQAVPGTELSLTTITIIAGATTPSGVTLITIYDENVEWTTGTSGTISASFTNGANPFSGTKAAFVNTYTNTSSLTFTDGSTHTASPTEVLRLFVYLNGVLIPANELVFQFYNSSTPVGSSVAFNTGYGLDPNETSTYQNISIPFSAFQLSSQTFNKLVISFVGQDISGAQGMYIDDIQLQTGISNVSPSLILTTAGSSGASTYDPVTGILNIPNYSGGGGTLTWQQTLNNGSSISTQNNDVNIGNSVFFSIHNNLGHAQFFLYPNNEYNIGDNGNDYGMGYLDIISGSPPKTVLSPGGGELQLLATPHSGSPDSVLGVGSDRITHLYPFFAVTADNGLTMASNNIKLGGTLTANTLINAVSNELRITGSAPGGGGHMVKIDNTSSSGGFALYVTSNANNSPSISGETTGGVSSTGISGDASNGIGVSGNSGGAGTGGSFHSNTGIAFKADIYGTTANTVEPIASFTKIDNNHFNAHSNGMGMSLDFYLSSNVSTTPLVNRLVSKWLDVTARTSEFSLEGINSSSNTVLLRVTGAGLFTLVQGLQNFANNAAALTGGLVAGNLYRSTDAVNIVH